jgi:hypothetical protein
MLKLDELRVVFDKIAPYEISLKTIANGGYDNSGILVRSTDYAEKILFSLDLSFEVVKKAIRLKVDTIVTHHPAIYSPLKSIECDNAVSGPVLLAIKNRINMPCRKGLRYIHGRKEGFLWHELMPMLIICLRIAIYVQRAMTLIKRVICAKFTTVW